MAVPRTSLLYRALVRAAVALAPVAGARSSKIASGLRARRGLLGRLEAWARDHRDRARPLLWLHASSVGEGLQAESVLRVLRDRHPDWQIAYTHFSPSSEALAARQPADLADYLPWDRVADVAAALEALRPTALVITKLDLWPELATQAHARQIAVGLIAATVSPVSGRLRWPSRALLRPGYAAVGRAGAIAPEDAERLARLGVPRERIEVTGDPRFDSAHARAKDIGPNEPLLRFGSGGDAATLVAGSTWPADEAVLLPAFARVREQHQQARLILVPHEPTERRLAAVERLAARLGLPRPGRLSAAGDPAPLLLVDRLGVLATLYAAGQMAYVGGGFGRAGLHSVLEPAACGRPVIVGPRWRGSREAGLLLVSGGAVALARGDGAAEELGRLWREWLERESERRLRGRLALGVVEAGLGGAERNAALVEQLMT